MTLLSTRPFFTTIILCLAVLLNAQTQELPAHFGQFYNNPQLNTAKLGAEGNFELALGTKQNTGVFRGISTSYATAAGRIESESGNFHVIGGHFNRDVEGELLSRNRFSASYARHFRLNDTRTLAIGIGAGMYQFGVKSNPVTGGASEGAFDTYAGGHLYQEDAYVGLSVRQLTGGEVRPYEQLIKLEPRYDLLMGKKIELSEGLAIDTHGFIGYAQVAEKSMQTRAGAALLILVSDIINAGASYEYDEGFHAVLGIRDIYLSSPRNRQSSLARLGFDLSYFIPELDNQRTNINSIEFTIRYFVSK